MSQDLKQVLLLLLIKRKRMKKGKRKPKSSVVFKYLYCHDFIIYILKINITYLKYISVVSQCPTLPVAFSWNYSFTFVTKMLQVAFRKLNKYKKPEFAYYLNL